MNGLQRRQWLIGAAALAAGCASAPPSKARVLVVGGGFGGATAAKYVRLFSDQAIDVVLVEPNENFVSCPLSNLVLGGSRTLAEITTPYTALQRRYGVRIVRDRVERIDPERKQAVLASGPVIGYDKLLLAPGIDLIWDSIEGLRAAHDQGRVLQAWKAGPETQALRRQLEDMPDGGVFAVSIPELPYRCPPGPYERACQVASYFKQAKPRSKVLVFDANPDITSKPALFRKSFTEDYAGIIDYRPQHKTTAVDARRGVIQFEVQEDERADVLNLLPTQRAGSLAVDAGLANAGNQRWVGVNWLDFSATAAKDIHVVGDAILAASAMPKSGHMANGHGKVAAAAIVAELMGWPVDPAPMLSNTCYSFVDARRVMHVASVHAYSGADKTFHAVPGAGGLSAAANELEARYAWDWARTIWSDMLG